MTLRRGQDLSSGERVVLCEDVVTTGKSIREIEVLAREAGAEVVALACIVDRSAGKWSHPLPLTSLLQMDLVTYHPDNCPMCQQGLELVKPGSRPKP
jgi:orotate phosphoribosyltransferase